MIEELEHSPHLPAEAAIGEARQTVQLRQVLVRVCPRSSLLAKRETAESTLS